MIEKNLANEQMRRSAASYPYTVTTYDERGSYDLTSTADREAATLAIAAVVQTERALAAGYSASVLSALSEAAAEAEAAPYLVL